MKIPAITVHGRFQPPLHINHANYVLDAFERAEKVTILITNPYTSEKAVAESSHRNRLENNPFNCEERVKIFEGYFKQKGISPDRYEFRPFDITNESSWTQTLDRSVPNLVNIYGEWSKTKAERFTDAGYEVITTNNPKEVSVSGSDIREIIQEDIPEDEKRKKLAEKGYAPEALDSLFEVLKSKESPS